MRIYPSELRAWKVSSQRLTAAVCWAHGTDANIDGRLSTAMFVRLKWTLSSIEVSSHHHMMTSNKKPIISIESRRVGAFRSNSEYKHTPSILRISHTSNHIPQTTSSTMPHSKTPGQSSAASDKFNKDQAEGMSLFLPSLQHCIPRV